MPSTKITDIQKDLPVLNRALAQLDQLAAIVKEHGYFFTQINDTLSGLVHQQDAVASNNLMLTWSGSTLKFTWPAAFVRDTTGKYYPIEAGTSPVLTASTYYWVAYNPNQGTLSFNTNIATLMNIPSSLIICQIYAGTSAQSGTAGGGGTDPGTVGIIGRTYKNF
jgi:hypothetical protein